MSVKNIPIENPSNIHRKSMDSRWVHRESIDFRLIFDGFSMGRLKPYQLVSSNCMFRRRFEADSGKKRTHPEQIAFHLNWDWHGFALVRGDFFSRDACSWLRSNASGRRARRSQARDMGRGGGGQEGGGQASKQISRSPPKLSLGRTPRTGTMPTSGSSNKQKVRSASTYILG